MTKKELIEALEQFNSDQEILIRVDGAAWYKLMQVRETRTGAIELVNEFIIFYEKLPYKLEE